MERAVFLVQREVAERLAASPGEKDWGVLSVFLQREADVSVERIVPPGAFFPPPRVHSAVVHAPSGRRRPPRCSTRPASARWSRPASPSGARRSGTRSRPARWRRRSGSAAALAATGLDPGRRGETLTVDEWAALERALGPVEPGGPATPA